MTNMQKDPIDEAPAIKQVPQLYSPCGEVYCYAVIFSFR